VNVTRGLVGTGKLTKIGNGYLYLNAAAPSSPVTWAGTSYSGFTGDVDVSAGVIQLTGVSNVLGTNTSGTQLVTISSGAAVVLNGNNGAYTANQNFVLNGTGTGQAANLGGLAALELTNVNFGNEQVRGLAVASNSTISVNRNSAAANTFGLDVNGPLAGTGTLTVTSLNASTSNATLYLKAAAGAVGSYSAFTGNVNIRNGARLSSNHATALGTTANVDVADGSVLSIGANQTLGGLTNATTVANTGSVLLNSRTLTIGSTNNLNSTFSGVVSNGSGAGGIIKDGTGTLTLTGDNSYTGSTGVTQGTLLIGGSGDINQTSGVTISTAGTFRYNSSVAYSGGAITNNGGTIAGSGTIGASVALDSLSDKLAPGNSPGIQNYGISQTWNAFTYQWETNNFTGTTAGTDFDQITITGSLTLDLAGSYAVDLLSLTALNAAGNVANFSEITRQWAILTASGGISNFDVGDWTINEAGFTSSPTRTGTFSLSADANNIYLNYALVPEPSGVMLAAVGMLGIAARRRRNAA
jgi:autotransporter-associated beta strand protein